MKRILICVLVWGVCRGVWAQDLECIVRLTGVSAVEDLDEEEVERLVHLLDHPVNVNLATGERLSSCGLFSPFQVASLIDYRERHGYVMSMMELSVVDGFNQDAVSVLAPFIDLSVNGLSRPDTGQGVRHELAVRGDLKAAGMKYTVKAGSRLIGGLGMTRTHDEDGYLPSVCTGNLQWNFNRAAGKVILGDFNARFGQGLALWSGMMMDNLTSPSAMMRNATGLSRSSSFNGNSAMSGAGMEVGLGNFTLSAAVTSNMALANLSWICRNGRLAMTHVYDGTVRSSVDAALCFAGVNAYGEAVYDWYVRVPSALVGTDFPMGENVRTGVQVRCLPGEAYTFAVSSSGRDEAHKGRAVMSANAIYYPVPKKGDDVNSVQVKGQLDCEYMFSERLQVKIRVSERFRTWGQRFRTDVRADVSYAFGKFSLASRINVLKCDGVSGLAYLEGAWKQDNMALYLRQGLFCVDDWDDRIYVYERDAPGSFNVPAMYGRGVWGSVVMSWKVSRALKVYLRCGYKSYVFMVEEKKKPGKAELKLHAVLKF